MSVTNIKVIRFNGIYILLLTVRNFSVFGAPN